MQRIGAIITSTAYWAFGIPLALVLVYAFNLGIKGLWYGALFAVIYNFSWYTYFYNKVQWQKLIDESAARRIRDGGRLKKKGGCCR